MASFLIIIVAALILTVVYCLFDIIRRKIKERVARRHQQQRPPLERTPHTINLGNVDLQVEMAKAELKARHKLLSEIVQLGTVLKTSDQEIMGDFAQSGDIVCIPEETCAICLSEYEHGEAIRRSSHCNHVYHDKCILDWLETNLECPCCRTHFVSPDIEMASIIFSPTAPVERGTAETATAPDPPAGESSG